MNAIIKRIFPSTFAALLALALVPPLVAQAAAVTIQVNGNTVSFDQPPIERGGRIYVPLRGVFERLGASVVYANRVINATGNGHNITLTIGSSSATVDGSSVGLDSPPFLVGSRTLVPLRFVAQALGATVNYNGNTRVVAITGGGGGGGGGPQPTPTANTGTAVSLLNLSPPNGGAVSSNRPTVSGNFSVPVDPNSVHLSLDGRDITSRGIYVSPTSFQVALGLIPAGQHTVTLTGNAQSGGAFSSSFTFTSGTNTSVPFVQGVAINGVAAANGMQVPNSVYTLTGQTTPNASVLIVIGYQQSILNGLIPIGGNTNSQTVTADGSGNFSASVDPSAIGNPSQYSIVLRATNTATTATSQPVQYTVHT